MNSNWLKSEGKICWSYTRQKLQSVLSCKAASFGLQHTSWKNNWFKVKIDAELAFHDHQ